MRKKKELERRALRKKYLEQQQKAGNGDAVFMSAVGPIDAGQLRVNAYHEAGHAVLGMRVGPGVEIVTIDPQRVKELTGKEFPGYTRYRESGPAKADIVLCLTASGLTSEAMFVSGGVVSSKEDDIGRLIEMLENQLGLRGSEKERELVRIRLMTQQLVLENRAAIEAVANALMEEKTLTGEDLQRILDR